jgi:hypothetical protein
MASRSETSTAPPEVALDRLRRARLGRRIGLWTLAVFVGAGLLNLFGSASGTVSSSAGGLELTVAYPDRTRPALPIRWKADVASDTGFSEPIRIAVNQHYFNYFDFNNLFPEPDSTENRGDLVIFTFAAPDTDTFTVLFDGRTQPGQIGIADAETKVLDGAGETLIEVDYSTTVWP